MKKKLRGVGRRSAQLAAEIELHVNISEHDLAIKIVLREREDAHPELARELLRRVVGGLRSPRDPGDRWAALRADSERNLAIEEGAGVWTARLPPGALDNPGGRTRPVDRTPDRRCSFCGRARVEVKKLVSGPRVYICDGCAAVAPGPLEHADCSFCGQKLQRGLRNSDGRVVICTDCLQIVDDIMGEE
jgi:hypothetical protein